MSEELKVGDRKVVLVEETLVWELDDRYGNDYGILTGDRRLATN
jgi:hypothetical protein